MSQGRQLPAFFLALLLFSGSIMPGASANDSAAAPLATETGSPEPGFATHRIEASAQASASETAKPVPTRVKVGVFFISGGKVDFVSSSVALDFYVWLTFTGSSTPQFEFLNSRNFQLSKLEEKMPAPGTNLNYSIFRCSGIFDQDFGLRNYTAGSGIYHRFHGPPIPPVNLETMISSLISSATPFFRLAGNFGKTSARM